MRELKIELVLSLIALAVAIILFYAVIDCSWRDVVRTVYMEVQRLDGD